MCWYAPVTQRWSLISTTKEVAFAPPIQAGAPDPWVVPGQSRLAENSSYSWPSEYGSRHPVEAGAKSRGMDGEAEVVKQTWRVWPGSGGHVCDSGDIALSPLVLSDPSSSTGAGSSAESVPDKQKSPILAGPSMLGPDFPSQLALCGDFRKEGSPLSGEGYDLSPPLGAVEVMDLISPGGHIS